MGSCWGWGFATASCPGTTEDNAVESAGLELARPPVLAASAVGILLVVSLSPVSRLITGLFGVLNALVGLVLFFSPKWSAKEFPWVVTDFVAMTMGGWCMGNAFGAWVAIRNWRWPINYGVLVYLWAFAVLEVVVLMWFRDKLRFGGLLAWPYVATLALGLAAAARGVLDASRLSPFPPVAADAPVNRVVRSAILLFIVFVGFIGAFGLVATDFGASERVFPEPLSPFTQRAFAAFYLALVIGALTLLPAPTLAPTLCYMRAGMGLIVPITIAAFVYLGRFDFTAHMGQAAYIAAYLVVAIPVMIVLAWARGRQPPLSPPNSPGGVT